MSQKTETVNVAKISRNGYSISGVKYFNGREGKGLNANLLKYGRKIAEYIDSANGGGGDYHFIDRGGIDETEFYSFLKTEQELKKTEYCRGDYFMNALEADYESAKNARKTQKKPVAKKSMKRLSVDTSVIKSYGALRDYVLAHGTEAGWSKEETLHIASLMSSTNKKFSTDYSKYIESSVKKEVPADKQADLDILDKSESQKYLGNLYSRWMDEKEYEDIGNYKTAIEKNLGIKIAKMTKKPFGFVTVAGVTICLTAKKMTTSW